MIVQKIADSTSTSAFWIIVIPAAFALIYLVGQQLAEKRAIQAGTYVAPKEAGVDWRAALRQAAAISETSLARLPRDPGPTWTPQAKPKYQGKSIADGRTDCVTLDNGQIYCP